MANREHKPYPKLERLRTTRPEPGLRPLSNGQSTYPARLPPSFVVSAREGARSESHARRCAVERSCSKLRGRVMLVVAQSNVARSSVGVETHRLREITSVTVTRRPNRPDEPRIAP